MAIAKMSSDTLNNMDMHQFHELTLSGKVVRDPTMKGKSQLRFKNEAGMDCSIRMKDIAAKFVSLGKEVTVENADKYLEIGRTLQILESKEAPAEKGSVLDQLVTGIRKAFEKVVGNKSKREGRLETYKKGMQPIAGYRKLGQANVGTARLERIADRLKAEFTNLDPKELIKLLPRESVMDEAILKRGEVNIAKLHERLAGLTPLTDDQIELPKDIEARRSILQTIFSPHFKAETLVLTRTGINKFEVSGGTIRPEK